MRTRRRGTIYVITLGMSLIVATLATAGLMAVRAQRNRAELFADTVQARLNAQSSLEMALQRMADTGDWRTDLAAIQLSVTEATADAITGFTGVDPVDANVADDPLDPMLITAVGVSGPATQKIEVRLKARQPGLRCLEPVIHGHEKLVFDSTTVNGDRMLSSNKEIFRQGGIADLRRCRSQGRRHGNRRRRLPCVHDDRGGLAPRNARHGHSTGLLLG